MRRMCNASLKVAKAKSKLDRRFHTRNARIVLYRNHVTPSTKLEVFSACQQQEIKKPPSLEPSTSILDVRCIHVTTGDAEMTNLRKEKVKMSGPSGEIMESTHRGTILFPRGEMLTLKFQDALVVPSLERNLLSLSRMLDSNPELSVVFNRDRFEGFKGQLSGVGTTLFQGQKDSSNLFALLSNVDESKAIVSAKAEPVAGVQVNDCVLNTVRKKNFVEDFASWCY